jgi:hypothetical protein
MRVEKKYEDRVEQLKACARGIINRAEELIGDDNYSTEYIVSIKLYPGEAPSITLERSIVPVVELREVDCL